METEGGEQEILLQGEPINIHYGQVDDVLVDGVSVVEDYIARISLRTVNDLINYYKKSETYTQTEVNNLIGQIQTAHFEVVAQLPAQGEDNIIYLVPRSETEEDNIYDEYIWISNRYEKIGSTDVDMSNYYTKSEVDDKLDEKEDKIDSINAGYSVSDIDGKTIYLSSTTGSDLYNNPQSYIGLSISTTGNEDIATVTDVVNIDGTITRNLKFTLGTNNYQGIRIYVGNYSDYNDVIFRGWLPKLYNVNNPNVNLINPITSRTMTTSWNYNKMWNIRGSIRTQRIDSTNYAVYTQSGDTWRYACYGDENLTLAPGTYIFSMNYSSTGGHEPAFYFSLGINGSYSTYTDVIDYIIDGTLGDTMLTTDVNSGLNKGDVIFFLDKPGNTMRLSESIAEGSNTSVFGASSHVEGDGTIVNGKYSHAEGRGNNFEVTGVSTSYIDNVSKMVVSGDRVSEIRKNAVIWCNGYYYVQEYATSGDNVELTLDRQVTNFIANSTVKVYMGAALASASHVEGNFNNTVWLPSTTEFNESDVHRNHAEGSRTLASGYAAHTEGEYTQALGDMSHAEGRGTTASGSHSHTEGRETVAYGSNAHVEGRYSTAFGDQAHAEGFDTHANGHNSHTSGYGTRSSHQNQFVIGEYNSNDWSNAFEVGNGTGNEDRSNAFEVKKDGSARVQTQGNTNDSVVQKQYVDNGLNNKLTEPSTGIAVGKYFRVANIDADGHAVLECVDAPTAPIQSISAAGTDLPPDASGNVKIPLSTDSTYGNSQAGIMSVANGSGLSNRGINTQNAALWCMSTDNTSIETRQKKGGVVPRILTNDKIDYIVNRAMTDGRGAAWTDIEKNGCYDRTTIRKTTIDNVLVTNAMYDLGSTEQSSLTLTLPTPSGTDNYSCNDIYVAFKSGSTATTLNIVGSYEGDTSYLPSANCICELSFKYICGTWVLVTKETEVSSS